MAKKKDRTTTADAVTVDLATHELVHFQTNA
jgi:hypothetical protein